MATPIQPISALLPYVIPHVPDCPDPTAEFNLRLAAIEFCERTRCWRHLAEASLTADTRTLAAPAFTTIHEIEQATFDGQTLIPISFTDSDHPSLTGTVMESAPMYVTQTEPGHLTVIPFRPGTLRVSVFLKPQHGTQFGMNPVSPLSDPLNVVPPFLVSQHAECVAFGALARIFALPGETWTDEARAAVCRAMFEERIASHASGNLRGQQRTPIRTKAQWV
jgi:hypothetical protein